MINISKSGNAIKFAFTDSDHYLYGNGEIECPVNSLSLIVDESNMVTFRKANSNDIFLSFNPANSNLSDKEGVINFYKTEMVGSTGGGSESGITSGEVQTMIDESLRDYYTDDEVDAALSGKASASDVAALENEVAAKADTSAVTAVANDVSTLSGQVATKVAITDFNAYSAATDSRLAEDEEVTAAALNDLQENKADTSAVTAVNDALTAHTSDTGIHVSAQEKNTWNAKAEPYSAGTGIEISGNVISATGGGGSVTVDPTLDTGSTNPVANSAITQALENKLDASAYTPTDLSQYWTSAQTQTAIDNAKAYYISFATIATTGIRDEDWDGIVAAIDDHRPIYAGYPRNDGGILYYGVECMNKNVSNTQIVLTSSDDNSHYFYTFTKNGSNDYTFTSETRPYVTDAEKTAWNAKAEPYSAGTGIEISGNVISATGGGGATYSAGYGINIDTANTISFNMPITCTTNTNDNITIGNGVNNGSWSLLVGNDMSITKSTGSIGLCVSDMSIGGSSISGNSRGILIGCQNTIKGGNINVGGGVAIGDRNQSTDGGIVIGANSKASGSSTVAIGLSANATGTTKMNLNNQIKVDTNNQIYIKDKTNTTDVCIQDAIAALGGLKLVQCTQAEYDALVQGGTVDSSTIYFITNVVS